MHPPTLPGVTAPPLAATVDTSLVVFSIVGVAVLVLASVAERLLSRRAMTRRTDRIIVIVVGLAALVALVAGVRFEATRVDALDVALTLFVLVGVALATEGITRAGGSICGVSVLAALGAYALAGFGHDEDLAIVMAAVAAAALAAAVSGPTVVGRVLRVATGFGLALGALLVDPVDGGARPALTPTLLVGLFALDAALVAIGRFRRRERLAQAGDDHLPHRLQARGWPRGRAVALLLLVQGALSVLAVFSGRAVLSPAWAALGGFVLLLVVGVLAVRGTRTEAPTRHIGRWVALGTVVVMVVVSVGVAATALAAKDAYDLMDSGRDHAKAGLSAARDGDTAAARRAFRAAAHDFAAAHDDLNTPLVLPSLAVPYLASNMAAARSLAAIGSDLADAGGDVAGAVQPSALDVVGGRLPVEEVRAITPKLARATEVLDDAERRLQEVRDDPYLLPKIRDAADDVHRELAKAAAEAGHATLAARLAPALFGADGPRRYLLVVQNNAESRATGGFIGNYGVLTAENGKLHVDRLKRTHEWNEALALSQPALDAPADYTNRYAQFRPDRSLQNVNLSPDFPSVGKVLMALAPDAGVGPVDGVMAVDPAGLAALLELTGPVEVEGWPVPVTAENVVDIALKEEYTAFAETPDRADFLGDIAQAAVEKATSENLGRPPQISKVLGQAAHAGHLVFAFARPDEQRLAEELEIAGQLAAPRDDSLAVTTSNAGANKIDVYLKRTVDADVKLEPTDDATSADVRTTVSVALTNEAPAEGLPQIVIGPYNDGFVAGQNRSLFSLYSPLRIDTTTVDGAPTGFNHQRERGQQVVSTFVDIPSNSTKTVSATLDGNVPLRDGWYTLRIDHQATYQVDQVHLSIGVPPSWRIDKAVRAKIDTPQQATATLSLERTTSVRVHIVRSAGASLWERLNGPG